MSAVEPPVTRATNAPVEHDETVTGPIARVDTVRHEAADNQAPVEVAVDSYLDALAKGTSRVFRQDGLGRLGR